MKFQAPRGFKDILPQESYLWKSIEDKARRIFSNYNFREIKLSIVENASLFNRTLGNSSEVVEKQMFLIPRGDDTLALRPEGTAGVVRAYLENNLASKGSPAKLFYFGPMFRAERPQKGRLRQFNHLGAELLGSSSPYADIEIINLADDILLGLGLKDYKINLNSLGDQEDKKKLSLVLRKAIESKLKLLCEDCQLRFSRNIFRVLDCKKPGCRRCVEGLEVDAKDYLSINSIKNFKIIKDGLDDLGIKFIFNPFLVRGLDYYTGTVFEITHPSLGAQDAIGAGGRYDSLVAELGGRETGCIGFAFGIERLILALNKDYSSKDECGLILYIAAMGDEAVKKALILAKDLRKENISVEVDLEDRKLDKKLSRANKSNARFAAIIAEDELKKNVVSLKDMQSGVQKEVSLNVKLIKAATTETRK